MTTTIAEAILHEIRRDGFSVGEHRFANVVTGAIGFHVDATDPRTGEAWCVTAPPAYVAAFELARQIGWAFSE